MRAERHQGQPSQLYPSWGPEPQTASNPHLPKTLKHKGCLKHANCWKGCRMAARASASEPRWDPRALASLPQHSPPWGDAQKNAASACCWASPAATPSLSSLRYAVCPVAHGHVENLGILQKGYPLVTLTLITHPLDTRGQNCSE